MPEPGKLFSEGKGKRIYETDDPDYAIVYFKDEAMAYHGLKRGRILGKGEVNNAVCAHIYPLLERNGIGTHFVEQLDRRQSLVRKCEMIPIAFKVRNRAAGSLSERFGLPVGQKMEPCVLEMYYRDEDETAPLLNAWHIRAMKLATDEELSEMEAVAMKVNSILTAYLAEIGIDLIDFKLEFGRYHGKVIVADEISPDTARFWDAKTHEPLDFDRFRRDLGNAAEAYQEVLHRMMGMDEQ
ncbi:MAG: phosphoribosylaminoimidazolesuccinocarboxamide synthase [Clostridia bacterium]|nr:phosphoribosylaminoimidazolesuccinocarboxamide synthase [Clostridia bacterium]